MMVANLSANAVAEIGGQSLLTRVACYYHDIGKLKHANFFVENLPAGAENPQATFCFRKTASRSFSDICD